MKKLSGRKKRRIPLRGTFEDEGRYFKCWNCGFICNIERDSLGGEESLSGIDYEEFYSDDNDEIFSYEEDLSSWTGVDASISGDVLTSSGANGFMYRDIGELEPLTSYVYRVELRKGDNSLDTIRLKIRNTNNTYPDALYTLTDEWKLYEFRFVSSSVDTVLAAAYVGTEDSLPNGKNVRVRYPRFSVDNGIRVETTEILYKPVVSSGCPLCGTLNWS